MPLTLEYNREAAAVRQTIHRLSGHLHEERYPKRLEAHRGDARSAPPAIAHPPK